MEIVVNFNGDAFRVVYSVRFAERIYVLHAFKKKSKHGAATPKMELDLIQQRLRRVQEEYEL